MKSEDKAEKIGQVMSHLADADQPAPDFESWLREHPQAVKNLTSGAERAERNFFPWAQNLWRNIMNSRIIKLTAAAVIIIGVIVGIKIITGPDRSGLAFARVLERIQTESYTYDLTFVLEGQTPPSVRVSVLPPRRLRFDAQGQQMGNVSTIADFATGESWLLFHAQKSAVPLGQPGQKPDTGQFFALLLKPLDTLWDLRDGTEENLGTKKINGQEAEGFKVVQEDSYYEYEITVWANAETADPLIVKILMNPVDASAKSVGIEMTMDNFDLQVELDEEIFQVPADYTLAYQKELDEIDEVDQPSSTEARKVESLLSLWSQGKKEETMQTLLSVNWKQEMKFSPQSYLFYMTEKGYISLKPQDQKKVIKQVMPDGSTIRQIAKEAVARGRQNLQAKKYVQAENYFQASFQLGHLVSRGPDIMLVTRMVGLAIRKLSAQAMIDLYRDAKDNQKLQGAEQQLRQVDAEYREIKQKLKGG